MIVRYSSRRIARGGGAVLSSLSTGSFLTTKEHCKRRFNVPLATSTPPPDRLRRDFTSSARQRSSINAINSKQSDAGDVVIVGGGVVGLALACSLASNASFRSSGASIALIEASSMDRLRGWHTVKKNDEHGIDDWENRAIYLTEENRNWLSTIGVDPFVLQNRLHPVNSMHVTDGLTGAALDFDAPRQGTTPLGVMAEINNLQQALLRRLEAIAAEDTVLEIRDNTKVKQIEASVPGITAPPSSSHIDSWPILHFDGDTAEPIKARLLIGADGHNSPVRSYAGIDAHGWSYDRMGVVGTLGAKSLGDSQTAYQRFLPTGTVAWLPLSESHASLVWTLPPKMARAVIDMQKEYEGGEKKDNAPSPIATLVTAAFRLPWHELEEVLHNLDRSEPDLSSLIPSLVEDVEGRLARQSLDPSSSHSAGVPPPAEGVLNRSVAGFPLKLSHAESYLGSSLRRTTFSEAGAAAITPSNILSGVIHLATSLTGKPSSPRQTVRGRTALIGDAAHTVHPLAGQGLNLGIADARSLSNAISTAVQEGGDIGSHVSLQAYPRERYIANQAVLSAVDHLHWLFAAPPPGHPANSFIGDLVSRGVVWTRSTGFEVLNELDTIKSAIIGAAGSAPSGRK